MQYPSMGRSRPYRVSIPQLSGGVNYAVPSHLIEDNQLSDVKNLWYRNGRLQTRPGVICLTDVADDYAYSYPVGEHIVLYTYGSSGVLKVALVDEDGAVVDQSSITDILGTGSPAVTSVTVFPVNSGAGEELSAFDIAFLVSFATGAVAVVGYGQNRETGDFVLKKLAPYVPTVLTGSAPQAWDTATVNGAQLEPFNMLTMDFKCLYTSDGVNPVFVLPEKGFDDYIAPPTITVTYTDQMGKSYTHTTNNRSSDSSLLEEVGMDSGTIIFETEANSADLLRLIVDPETGKFFFVEKFVYETTGQVLWNRKALSLAKAGNNVEFTITFNIQPAEWEYTPRGNLNGMTLSTWFGGGSAGLSGGTRLFVSGNADHPNLVHWSALNDPLYFPENNYAYVGQDGKRVTAFGKQGELLVIFKDREMYYTQYIQGSSATAEELIDQTVIDIEAAAAVFPMIPIHSELGCDCPDTIRLCNNRLVWLNSDGNVYGLFTTGQYNERNVRALSHVIRPKLAGNQKSDMQSASAAELESNYLLLIGNTVYVMDYSSNGFNYYSSYGSDERAQKAVQWYVWDVLQAEDLHIQKLTSAGRKPLLIGVNENPSTVVMTFCEEMPDRYRDAVGIPCMFKTKLFDFGYPERLKRVNPLYLQVSGDTGETLKLTYFCGNGDTVDVYSPVLTGTELEMTAPMRITPNAVRVREFGLGVECDGRMEVGNLTLNYAMMGTVR